MNRILRDVPVKDRSTDGVAALRRIDVFRDEMNPGKKQGDTNYARKGSQ